MPKKGGRSHSKRTTLKDKFKIIRKVKEHNRKKRKEAKKLGKKKPSLLKDPGIPNNYPYRDQVVQEMKFEQARILAQEAERKEANKLKRAVRKLYIARIRARVTCVIVKNVQVCPVHACAVFIVFSANL